MHEHRPQSVIIIGTLMWLLLQSAIIFAVLASNIHWQWTPNGYLAALIGIGIAFAATSAVNWIADRASAGLGAPARREWGLLRPIVKAVGPPRHEPSEHETKAATAHSHNDECSHVGLDASRNFTRDHSTVVL
jgi:hypothetical protein